MNRIGTKNSNEFGSQEPSAAKVFAQSLLFGRKNCSARCDAALIRRNYGEKCGPWISDQQRIFRAVLRLEPQKDWVFSATNAPLFKVKSKQNHPSWTIFLQKVWISEMFVFSWTENVEGTVANYWEIGVPGTPVVFSDREKTISYERTQQVFLGDETC